MYLRIFAVTVEIQNVKKTHLVSPVCIETLYKRATSVVHLTKLLQDASPLLLYYGAKKSKIAKTSGAGVLPPKLVLISSQ